MGPEIGQYALILALLASLLQAVFSLYGSKHGSSPAGMGWIEAGRRAAFAALVFTVLAFAMLTLAHLSDDFSVLNVYMNSHSLKPWLYKFSGVWGSHEGSMMLWLLMLVGFGGVMAARLKGVPLKLKAAAIGIQGLMGFGFTAFILVTSNPFARLLPIPLEGRDLNPLLQDPGLAFHPPFLYFGYVGFSSVFSLAAAQLLQPWAVAPWSKWVRPYALSAWASLTVGMAMGSWWAYYELGWGGWWFWDPVENAALMPWLCGTALVHSLLASWQRGALAKWTVLLSIITFSLSLLGTFLVRSGVLTSVHSFASDPMRGIVILSLLAVMIGAALMLYGVRASTLRASPAFQPLSRESAILLNNFLLCAGCATVFIGTLYPIILQALGSTGVSVGGPYFTYTMLPIMLPLVFFMAIGPWVQWRVNDAAVIARQMGLAFVLAVSAIMVTAYFEGTKTILGLLGIGVAFWVGVSALEYGLKKGARHGVVLAHLGLALSVLGMSGSAFSSHHMFALKLNEVVKVEDYEFTFTALEDVAGPNYRAERGTFVLKQGDKIIATLTPERRYYPSQQMTLSDVSISTNLFRDIYLAMSEEQPGENGDTQNVARVVRLQFNPLVPWIWLGAIIMAIGGLIGLLPRRYAGPEKDIPYTMEEILESKETAP